MRRYFITGGTGFIGRALVRELLKRRDTEKITCLTRGRNDLIEHPKLDYWRGDITTVEFPDEKHRFTDLIHAAAEANDLLNPDQPRYYHAVVEGADRIFEWAHTRDFHRILFVSSGCVSKGNSTYCRAKRLSEWLIERHNLTAKVARVYSVVGEELPLEGQYAIGRFVGSALKGEVSFYRSHSVRSYLHVEDCARHLLDILERGDEGKAYDVGSTKTITVTELAYLVANVFQVPIRVIKEKHHPTSVVYVPGVDRWQGEETITLVEALRRIRATFADLCDTNLEPFQTTRKVH
jgi:nucleoside-diphosphate-sugar epimerase